MYIISKSVHREDLPNISEEWQFQEERLDEFYNNHYYIGISTDIPVSFVNNEADYKCEPSDLLKFMDFSKHQYAYSDVQIPGVSFPKIRYSSFGKYHISTFRTTKTGLSQIAHSNQPRVENLKVPTPWDIVSAYADAAGYRLEFSDKGRVGNEIVRLIGGVKNIWFISHPAIIDLFLEMSNIKKVNEVRKLIRENIADDKVKGLIFEMLPRKSLNRKSLSFSEIMKLLKERDSNEVLDEKDSKLLIDWLLSNGLLRQGRTVSCGNCFTDNWVSISDFDSTIVCSGCLAEMQKPFGIQSIEWEYALNSLVSTEIDQGLLIHLLTVFHIFDGVNLLNHKGNVYGTYFGLEFVGEKDNKGKEVDIAVIVDGQLIIGECKVSGREFTTEFVQGFIDFAREVNSPKVILSCIEHVADLRKILENIRSGNIEVVVLDKNELFYQSPGLLYSIQFEVERGSEREVDKPEEFRKHLEYIREGWNE